MPSRRRRPTMNSGTTAGGGGAFCGKVASMNHGKPGLSSVGSAGGRPGSGCSGCSGVPSGYALTDPSTSRSKLRHRPHMP